MPTDDFAPCRYQHAEGLHTITFNDFDATADIFDEAGYDGGGYGWHGAVEALIRLHAPKIKKKIQFDPEASLFVAFSRDVVALKQVALLIRQVCADHELLRTALEQADPDLMD